MFVIIQKHLSGYFLGIPIYQEDIRIMIFSNQIYIS